MKKMIKIREKFVNLINDLLVETEKYNCKVTDSGLFSIENSVYFFIDTAGGGKEVKFNFLLGTKEEVLSFEQPGNLN